MPEKRVDRFQGHLQAQDTWCWAAVVASIKQLSQEILGSDKSYPQCYWVRRQHPGPACALHRDVGTNNSALRPYAEIQCVENRCSIGDQPEIGFAGRELDEDFYDLMVGIKEMPVRFSAICSEIDIGLPVIIRVEHVSMMHHLLIIIGYNALNRSLILWDPARGERVVRINELSSKLGRWTHTIFVRLPSPPS